MDPARLGTGPEVADHMATLNDLALSDFLAAVEAAEIKPNVEPHLGRSAYYYATKLAWPVFPLKPCSKQPLTTHGFKDATTDADTIRAWWTRWPDANIGTPTGAGGCGYDVIDVDGVPGFASLAEIRHEDCPPDCCASTFCDARGWLPEPRLVAFTPGDPAKHRGPGRHLFVSPSGDGNSTSLADGIDYRGDGGYVVLPPSIGPSGARYSWLEAPVAS